MEYEWGKAGDHGCENIAAGDSITDTVTREGVSAVPGRASGQVQRGWHDTDSMDATCAATGGRASQVL